MWPVDYGPIGFDHIMLVSKPGPKEWPYSALPTTPPVNCLLEFKYTRSKRKMEISVEQLGVALGLGL